MFIIFWYNIYVYVFTLYNLYREYIIFPLKLLNQENIFFFVNLYKLYS